MKAIIMAGGLSTRLRPITCTIPKPMARICKRPVMEHIIRLLKDSGISECAATLLYLPDEIKNYFGDGSELGVYLTYFEEEKPLGTAGGVKACTGFIDSTVLIISGDAACSFDLKAAIAFHKKQKADATIVLTKVDEPYDFGVVMTDDRGLVTGFIEKPSVERAYSDTVNTGIYILEKSCFDLIPDGVPFDFSKDLFPLMLKNKMRLMGFEAKGYWCDIGTPEKFLTCNMDGAEGRYPCYIDGEKIADNIYSASNIPEGTIILPPCVIGENVRLGENVVIGPFAIVEDNVRINDNTSIKRSVIGDNTVIGTFCEIRGAYIAPKNTVKEGTRIFEGAVIGERCVIGKNTFIDKGVKIWPAKEIESKSSVIQNIIWGTPRKTVFDDDGICGSKASVLSPSVAACAGFAVARASKKGRIVISNDGSPASKMLSMSFRAGVLGSGGESVYCGECAESVWKYAVSSFGGEIGAYIHDWGNKYVVKLCTENGLWLNSDVERKIEALFDTEEGGDYKNIGEEAEISGINELYRNALIKSCNTNLNGIKAEIHCPDISLSGTVSYALKALSCTIEKGGITFFLSPDGESLTCTDERGSFYSKEFTAVIIALCDGFLGSKKIYIPCNRPYMTDNISETLGIDVIRVSENSEIADLNSWLVHTDAAFGAIRILAAVKLLGKPLYAIAKDIPAFYVLSKSVEAGLSPSVAMGLLQKQNFDTYEFTRGLKVTSQKGKALISPSREGKMFVVRAEAYNSELANELCADISAILKNEGKKDK